MVPILWPKEDALLTKDSLLRHYSLSKFLICNQSARMDLPLSKYKLLATKSLSLINTLNLFNNRKKLPKDLDFSLNTTLGDRTLLSKLRLQVTVYTDKVTMKTSYTPIKH